MPTYVYKFIKSGETIEVQQAFTDDALTTAKHPKTGRIMPVRKVFLPVGVSFKGGGFYKTDSRNGSGSSNGSSASSDSGSSTAGSGESSSNGSSTSVDSAGASTSGESGSKSATPATPSTPPPAPAKADSGSKPKTAKASAD